MSTRKPAMRGIDACVAMHTALRKNCDSPATTTAYNLIHIISDLDIKPQALDPWRLLGEIVAENLAKGTSAALVLRTLNEGPSLLVDRWFKVVEARREAGKPQGPEKARTALHALNAILQCFSPAEFDAMAAYLKEDA